ncbi:MAG: glycosyltransferase family 2 protein [Synechococcales cyanobacterium]
MTPTQVAILVLVVLQVPAALVLLWRLLRALGRLPPLGPLPQDDPDLAGTVTVVVPTLNEGSRIQPCLEGLHQQGSAVREILIVDSRSQDDTVAKVEAMQTRDPRFRVITDPPLPPDWVGRPWALHHGFLQSDPSSTWILGIDADTLPQPGLVNSLVRTAHAGNWDILTAAPRFVLQFAGESWIQPALLITLIYRFGAAGEMGNDAERVMANGQCMLARRRTLVAMDGYTCAKQSFCDDVTLVRAAARQGSRVGFADGAEVLQVRMYTSFAETWREWGRSLALKDGAPAGQGWIDALFLLLVQGLPLPCSVWLMSISGDSFLTQALLAVNLGLLAIRWGMLLAIAPSYVRKPWTFWLSPLADLLATGRIWQSMATRPRQWRGRTYT